VEEDEVEEARPATPAKNPRARENPSLLSRILFTIAVVILMKGQRGHDPGTWGKDRDEGERIPVYLPTISPHLHLSRNRNMPK